MLLVLNWDRKFQEVRIKMEESIGRLSNVLMPVELTYLNENLHFMPKVYFGCGVMELTDA